METVYQVYSRLNNSDILEFQSNSLRKASIEYTVLIESGFQCWIQVKEVKSESL